MLIFNGCNNYYQSTHKAVVAGAGVALAAPIIMNYFDYNSGI